MTPLFIREGHADAWRPWFAWRPVWVADFHWPYPRQKRVWLSTILRRRFNAAPWFLDGHTWWWQYAEADGLMSPPSTEKAVPGTQPNSRRDTLGTTEPTVPPHPTPQP